MSKRNGTGAGTSVGRTVNHRKIRAGVWELNVSSAIQVSFSDFKKKSSLGNFAHGPMTKSPGSRGRRSRFQPWSGN